MSLDRTPRLIGRRTVLKAGAALVGGAALGSDLRSGAFAQGRQEVIPEALITAAKKEGTLTYYHTTAIDVTNSWTGAFTKKYGIETQNVRGPSYPLFERWLNESRVGKHIADVMQITDNVLIEAAHKEGWIANYKPVADPAIRPSMKREGIWYTLFVNAMGIMYNTNRVTPEEEKMILTGGWDVLTDPRWKGRYATATPASGGSSFSFCYMFQRAMKDRYGEPFLKKLAANQPVIYQSKAPMYDRMAAGEHAIADQASQSDMGLFYIKGAPVRWVFPDPTPANLTIQSVTSKGPNPNAARLFQEWAMSKEGQAEWFKFAGTSSAREDTVDPRVAAKTDWHK
jgi:iron(III) transport system substrate-binding protein